MPLSTKKTMGKETPLCVATDNGVTYMGVGGTKKWERLESYGPK